MWTENRASEENNVSGGLFGKKNPQTVFFGENFQLLITVSYASSLNTLDIIISRIFKTSISL